MNDYYSCMGDYKSVSFNLLQKQMAQIMQKEKKKEKIKGIEVEEAGRKRRKPKF